MVDNILQGINTIVYAGYLQIIQDERGKLGAATLRHALNFGFGFIISWSMPVELNMV